MSGEAAVLPADIGINAGPTGGRFVPGAAGVGRIDAALVCACGRAAEDTATGLPGNDGGDTFLGAAVLCQDLSGESSYYTQAGAVDRRQIFRVASQTKAVTSVCALMLVEEGLLHLAAPVANYLHELAALTVAKPCPASAGGFCHIPVSRDALTVRHLLNHTGGFA